MKAPQANLLNAIVLIAAGIIGYFFILTPTGEKAPTALIPAAFGLLFLVLHKGVVSLNKGGLSLVLYKKIVISNKIIAHVVVVLTALLLFICAKKFFSIDGWEAKKYLFLVCVVSNVIALIAFIGSFIEARKNRTA